MTTTVHDPRDILLNEALTANLFARANNLKSGTAKNVLFGSSALVTAAGIAIATIVWANNQGLDPVVLQAALAKMPALKVEPVKVDPTSTVALRDGAQVELKDGGVVDVDPNASVSVEEGGKVVVSGTVGIEPGSTVKVEGELSSQPMPTVPNVKAQPTTVDNTAIKREVTVFNHVVLDSRRDVVTGWQFENGKSVQPKDQFCYVSRPMHDGRTERTDIGLNGVALPNARQLMGNKFAAAIAKCVWWRKGAA